MTLSRRQFTAGALALGCPICAASRAFAAQLRYDLEAHEIAPKTWAVFGAQEHFTFKNGGAIVNVAFVEVPDGVVVVDTGPSRRYGEALKSLIEATVPGKPILRVYNTHHHPDHVFGNQVFEPGIIGAPQGVIDNIKRDGEGFSDALYRLIGDWMRGTYVVPPRLALTGPGEEVGGRRFSFFPLSGHTSADFAIRDDDTGVLFAGDLCFLDRAPTTPHADVARWTVSLHRLRGTDRLAIVPGHGPLDLKGASIDQTLDYLAWLDGALRDAVERGLTMNEAMALPIPKRFQALGVVRAELERSVSHLYQGLEDQLLPEITVTR